MMRNSQPVFSGRAGGVFSRLPSFSGLRFPSGIPAWILMFLLLLGLTALPAGPARAETAETAEWTVMLYMCGTDLESRHSLGTSNLNDIASMWFPKEVMASGEDGLSLTDLSTDGVNLVIETGGAREWHGMEPDGEGRILGLDIPADRLSRYSVHFVDAPETYGYVPSFTLADQQPLASMGRPETLSSFIRWAARLYPAKKYALVLWGHGGGSRTGLFVDELFDNDILYLYELDRALSDGGTPLELVAMDACLMCSLETAQNIAPYARYMVASEEIAAGYGSAIPQWLTEIYRNPGSDGKDIGREFCDATERKYAEHGTAQEETQLTYSVIDLSRMDAVSAAFDRLFEYAGELYEQMPARFKMFCYYLFVAERYGAGYSDMYDLGSFLYNRDVLPLLDFDCRNNLADALRSAVCYSVRGSARSASRGLSFCFAPNMTSDELDIFAQNCRSAPYLALLDAVTPGWTAPDRIYERTRRLAPIESLDAYRIVWEETVLDGLPALRFLGRTTSLLECTYTLYRLEEDSGLIRRLGTCETLMDWDEEGNVCYVIEAPTVWPVIDGELCCINLLDARSGSYLFNVPVLLGPDSTNLRVRAARSPGESSGWQADAYEVLGLWEGYDEDSRMPARSIISLNQVSGQEFHLLYPRAGLDGHPESDAVSGPLTMYRALKMENEPLPAGTYYCVFDLMDIFGNKYTTALTGLAWDGIAFSLAEPSGR